MAFLLIGASLLTLASLLLALLWRLGLVLLRRRAPGFWRRALIWHAGLFAFHLLVTVPLALGVLLAGLVGTRGDESRYRGPRLAEDGSWLLQSREGLAAERERPARALDEAAARRAVFFTARDGVRLRAFLVPARKPLEAGGPRFAAVLVHGLFRGALELETPGNLLRELGGEVLLLELRNHGMSGRAPPTFGRDEALDVLAAVDFLRSRPATEGRPLVLFAVSLGTAAAALAAPEVPDLDGLILDAPMDDLAAAARRLLTSGGFWIAMPDPWAATILFSARHLAGVPLDAVKPREALSRLSPDVEVLLIGAGHDRRMPPETVRALFESLPTLPERKELWIDPEASHGKVWVQDPEEYRRRLARFCDRVVERHQKGEPSGGRVPDAEAAPGSGRAPRP